MKEYKQEYKNGDFKAYYCEKMKRHMWVLGDFGGGPIHFESFKEVAQDFSEEYNVKIDTIFIDEVFKSMRYKEFKVIYSMSENQLPDLQSKNVSNVWEYLTD